jgi:hypothetical protein
VLGADPGLGLVSGLLPSSRDFGALGGGRHGLLQFIVRCDEQVHSFVFPKLAASHLFGFVMDSSAGLQRNSRCCCCELMSSNSKVFTSEPTAGLLDGSPTH